MQLGLSSLDVCYKAHMLKYIYPCESRGMTVEAFVMKAEE